MKSPCAHHGYNCFEMAEDLQIGYRLLRRFATFWINRFFHKIEIHGARNIPDGAVILAMNHPNNLIDSLMISYAIERKIHYLATSQFFRNKLLALFLHNAGVIPVYRKQDDPAHNKKNVATFQACYEVLNSGGTIGIYPEGTTHSEPRVKPIKTGAARIALETEQQFPVRVNIVPVGLNFSVRKSFRGEVLISFGAPIDASGYLPQYKLDPIAAVEHLTSDLQDAMEKEVLHIDAPELDQLVKDIEEIYKGELISDLIESGHKTEEVDSFRLSQKLVEGIHFFNKRDPARLMKIREEVNHYNKRLRKAHLQDKQLHEIDFRTAWMLLRLLLLLAGLPLALWGWINHFLPYQLTRWISQKIAKKETDYATTRILSGILLYSAFYTAQIYWVLLRFGIVDALVYGFTLPLSGAFAYYYWDKFKVFSAHLRLYRLMLTRRHFLNQLKERRGQLIAEMDRAKEDYLQQ
jgi:glycerol-3-phosphate O-acyltransferase/dihydroxyacetone phosphate acyltransferase